MKIEDLPALGQPLDGGIFAGLTTARDGRHYAVVLLLSNGEGLTWAKAKAWAQKQGGKLPTRPVAALLFANCKPRLSAGWHWTSEEDEDDASYAWTCSFGYGHQLTNLKSFAGRAVAVRMILLDGQRGTA